MPAKTVEETLSVWRELDRLLEELTPRSTSYEDVRAVMNSLRATYADLTGRKEVGAATLERANRTLKSAYEVMARVRRG